ncbi:unnamed protein product [Effrenium voratum]|nr:unnamed protein product [Effrenium voratum]
MTNQPHSLADAVCSDKGCAVSAKQVASGAVWTLDSPHVFPCNLRFRLLAVLFGLRRVLRLEISDAGDHFLSETFGIGRHLFWRLSFGVPFDPKFRGSEANLVFHTHKMGGFLLASL